MSRVYEELGPRGRTSGPVDSFGPPFDRGDDDEGQI